MYIEVEIIIDYVTYESRNIDNGTYRYMSRNTDNGILLKEKYRLSQRDIFYARNIDIGTHEIRLEHNDRSNTGIYSRQQDI